MNLPSAPLRLILPVATAIALSACGGGTSTGTTSSVKPKPKQSSSTAADEPATPNERTPATKQGDGGVKLRLKPVIEGLEQPVFVTEVPGIGGLVVAEKTGRVIAVDGKQRRVLLDLSDRVSSNDEQGLLGFAVPPDVRTSHEIYVNYTNDEGDTRISRYVIPDPGKPAATGEGDELLAVDQPADNHNGGMLAFGGDGALYAGLGDGGDSGDPSRNGQNPDVLLAKMIRIDTKTEEHEIVASGLRNPWRYSFDEVTGDMWIGDVGQGDWEEVDVIPDLRRGLNFGWNGWEGRSKFADGPSVPKSKVTMPVLAYFHDVGCSITGGYVYRGSAIPQLVGWYVYADYCQEWIKAFSIEGVTAAGESNPPEKTFPGTSGISSFGVDLQGELYVTSLGNGSVYKLVAA